MCFVAYSHRGSTFGVSVIEMDDLERARVEDIETVIVGLRTDRNVPNKAMQIIQKPPYGHASTHFTEKV